MRILAIHSDHLDVKLKEKAIKSAEEGKKGQEIKAKDVLVVFTSVEKGDNEGVVSNYVKEVEKIFKDVKAKEIVVYPYAHLSSNLASPSDAKGILEKIEKELKKKKLPVKRTPFGWYKAFEISCKGHPLSELSREIKSEMEEKPKKEKGEKKGEKFHRFVLVDMEGKTYEITRKNWKKSEVWKKKGKEYERLKQFVKNEISEEKGEKEEPAHVSLMRMLELVDYCSVSDAGHMKWYPKGILIRELILDFQGGLVRKYGAFKILNPLVYRLSEPRVNALLGEFHERDYSWDENGERLILRFASDPGAFPFMANLTFSYKQMPIKEYEEAICFRKEQRGELVGVRRVRNFLMTDLHAFCVDKKQAMEEFEKLCDVCKNLMDSIISKGNWVLGWEGVESYFEENKKWFLDISKKMKVPAFFKLMKKRSHYYSMKNEFQSIEADGANSQISTVQLDHVNGERFGITYVGKDNEKHPCHIVHCSTFGSIERTLCAILENAAIEKREGKNPILPLWLSPTQVRLCTVSDEYLKYAEEVAEIFEKEEIRVDIDDRVESVPKKVRDAEVEWIPYILVIGEKEKSGKVFNVRRRKTGKEEKMSLDKLVKEIKDQAKGYPYRPLPLPRLVSKRPKFVG